MKVLVTGANGFLGRHVVRALVSRGHSVRALVRPAARTEGLGWPDEVELLRADLRGSEPGPAFASVDVLVHLAAAVTGGEDAQFAATVVGTERLLEAMRHATTRRLVLASSFSVYDWSRISGTLDETSPLESGDDLYGRDGYAISKTWQERITRAAAERNGWTLTVLRPGWIWGRGQAEIAGLGQRLGPVYLAIGPRTRLPLTHVENCADVFARAVDAPGAAGRTLNVVDDDAVEIGTYLRELLRRTSDDARIVPVPYALAHGVARLAQVTSRTLFRGKGKLPGVLVPERLEARFKPLRFPNAAVREALGWTPPLDWDTRLARTYGPVEVPPATVRPPVRAAS